MSRRRSYWAIFFTADSGSRDLLCFPVVLCIDHFRNQLFHKNIVNTGEVAFRLPQYSLPPMRYNGVLAIIWILINYFGDTLCSNRWSVHHFFGYIHVIATASAYGFQKVAWEGSRAYRRQADTESSYRVSDDVAPALLTKASNPCQRLRIWLIRCCYWSSLVIFGCCKKQSLPCWPFSWAATWWPCSSWMSAINRVKSRAV